MSKKPIMQSARNLPTNVQPQSIDDHSHFKGRKIEGLALPVKGQALSLRDPLTGPLPPSPGRQKKAQGKARLPCFSIRGSLPICLSLNTSSEMESLLTTGPGNAKQPSVNAWRTKGLS